MAHAHEEARHGGIASALRNIERLIRIGWKA
jgi:hypothetical protein